VPIEAERGYHVTFSDPQVELPMPVALVMFAISSPLALSNAPDDKRELNWLSACVACWDSMLNCCVCKLSCVSTSAFLVAISPLIPVVALLKSI